MARIRAAKARATPPAHAFPPQIGCRNRRHKLPCCGLAAPFRSATMARMSARSSGLTSASMKARKEGKNVADKRNLAKIMGVVAAILLFYGANPWVEPPEGTISTLVTYGFWISFIALLVLLFMERNQSEETELEEVHGPRFARFLFNNTQAGLFWLPIRLFLGFSWIEASLHKLTGTGWLDGGTALKGFWTNIVVIPDTGKAAISFESLECARRADPNEIRVGSGQFRIGDRILMMIHAGGNDADGITRRTSLKRTIRKEIVSRDDGVD